MLKSGWRNNKLCVWDHSGACACGERKCDAQRKGGTSEGILVGCTPAHLSSLLLAILTFWAVEFVVPPEEWPVYNQTTVFPYAEVGANRASAARCIAHSTQAVMTSTRAVWQNGYIRWLMQQGVNGQRLGWSCRAITMQNRMWLCNCRQCPLRRTRTSSKRWVGLGHEEWSPKDPMKLQGQRSWRTTTPGDSTEG